MPVSIRVVSSLASPVDVLKSQSINKSIFLEPNYEFVAFFYDFYIG